MKPRKTHVAGLGTTSPCSAGPKLRIRFPAGSQERTVRSEYNRVWSDHVANLLSMCGMKHSETDLRTRKLIAIVVTVSNNPPDARAKKYENCQGERPPSRVLGVLRQIGEHRLCPRL